MRRLLLALALVGGLCAPALAQGFTDLSGNECWNAGEGIGGPSQFLCSDVLRNSRQIVVGTLTGAVTIGVTTSPDLRQLRWGGNFIVTAQPSAAVVTMPPNPVPDGTIVGICNPTAAPFATNVVTVAGNTGQTSPTNNALTTLAAGACGSFQFNRPNTTWYRIQ